MNNQQTIFRVASRQKPYSQLGNEMIRDGRLSWEARGILSFILSYPPDWHFTLHWLCRNTETGRDRAQRMLKELVATGYCHREQTRKEDGTLGPYEYVFSDEPEAVAPQPEKPVAVERPHCDVLTATGKPVTGQPVTAKPVADLTKKDISKSKSQRSISANSEVDRGAPRPAQTYRYVSENVLDQVRNIAPGWDRQFLLRKFLDWEGSLQALDVDRAFLGWVRKFTKGKQA